MINIRELRTGNWVYNKFHGRNIKITPFDFFTHGHDPDGYQYIVQSYSITTGRDLEPIPLTAEILEKNGFIYYNYGHNNFGYKIDDSESFVLEKEYSQENVYLVGSVVSDNESYILLPFAKIRYVHQLQNILIDMGIDKEIIL